MTSIAYSLVNIQTSSYSVPSTPSWFGEVVLIIEYLRKQGVLSKLGERMRFRRRRFGQYEVIDFLAVLFGYAISDERTLEAFYERLQPFAVPFMALFERDRLPARSTLSRFLAALTQEPVEALRSLFLDDLLILDLGFSLHLDPTTPYGFDAEKTLPCRYWFSQKLRTLDPALLQTLLYATVRDLKEEIPGLGEVVAFDVKHIYAWVKENNERAYVSGRYDKTHILVGDPECKLGVKRSTNQEQSDGTIKEKKELIWGYGSGVATATTPDDGDVVLAEYTQPFNEGDVTYFRPLYQQAVVALEQFPTHVTADAAYDAWYVYEVAARHGGIGAVPLNQHSKTIFDPDMVPLCPISLRMNPVFDSAHTNGYRPRRYRCPLLFPISTGQSCTHAQFAKGKGCQKEINIERGGQMRLSLDREHPLYHAIYQQRTSCERINSQAQALGIENPKVHNRRSVANLNTLIYLIINGRALDRVKSINRGLLQMS